jgi:hypothetical protein
MFAHLTKSKKLVDRYQTSSPTPVYLPLLLSTAPVAAALASPFDLPEILAFAFELIAWTMPSARRVDTGARSEVRRSTMDSCFYIYLKKTQRYP